MLQKKGKGWWCCEKTAVTLLLGFYEPWGGGDNPSCFAFKLLQPSGFNLHANGSLDAFTGLLIIPQDRDAMPAFRSDLESLWNYSS